MNASVEWRTGFLYYRFEGSWAWVDFYEVVQKGVALRNYQSADVVLDFRKLETYALDAVLHLKPAIKLIEQNSGQYVIIADGSRAQTAFIVFTRIYSSVASRFHLVSSLEEATAVLKEQIPVPSLVPESA